MVVGLSTTNTPRYLPHRYEHMNSRKNDRLDLRLKAIQLEYYLIQY